MVDVVDTTAGVGIGGPSPLPTEFGIPLLIAVSLGIGGLYYLSRRK